MWTDLLVFVPLAVLTNTAFPLAFDPVLLSVASRHSFAVASSYAALGALCAAVAGFLDAKVLGAVGSSPLGARLPALPHLIDKYFYPGVVVMALLPLPFSLVRVALVAKRPHPALYGAVVAAGRLPRYLLTVYFWQSLTLPPWIAPVMLLAAVPWAMWHWGSFRARNTSDTSTLETPSKV
jgi:uncharacterized membrane protein YdjX (TVP38/TMEM64 family)